MFFASAAPPVRYPNVYGIDMPAAHELVAHDRTVEEVRDIIGADWLVFQELDDLIEAAREGNPAIRHFDCSVFNGKYITGDVDQRYLKQIARDRSDAEKMRRDTDPETEAAIELHNNE